MTSFLFQECVSPQWLQATLPGLRSVATKASSSITIPVTLSFFVTGHRTKIRLITVLTSHIGGLKARSFLPSRRNFGKAAFHSKKKPTTLNKYQQALEPGLFRVFPASASGFMNTFERHFFIGYSTKNKQLFRR
jgi:hypothetical protein